MSLAAAAAALVTLCGWTGTDKKPCEKPATHRFRWEWGEEGHVCSDCVPLMQQTAGNLGRGITFTSLDQSSQQPVTLHERTQLIAAKLSAETELKEVTLRGQQLYQSNVNLTAQVQTLTMQKQSVEAQLSGSERDRGELADRLQERETELAEVIAERDRLKILVPFVGTAPAAASPLATERGLPSSSVVDG